MAKTRGASSIGRASPRACLIARLDTLGRTLSAFGSPISPSGRLPRGADPPEDVREFPYFLNRPWSSRPMPADRLLLAVVAGPRAAAIGLGDAISRSCSAPSRSRR